MSPATDPTARPDVGRRLAAALALLALVAAVAVLVVGILDRPGYLVLSALSLAVAVVGGWYALSRRGSGRVVGVVLLAVGLVAFLAVMVALDFGRVLVLALGIAAGSVAAAGYALREPAVPEAGGGARAGRPEHPVLIMNLKSGGGKAERFHLVDECERRGIEPIVLTPGVDLLELAEDAVARGADVIGMAGGDGSQALVASVASRLGVPHVVVPAGTRNHFALDLGLDRDDVVGALDAFADGVDRVIDLAEVNGRVFVNNASMGVYAKVVQSAEYRDAKVATAAAMLPDIIGPDAVPMDLRYTTPSGEERPTAQLILVSNNVYDLHHLRGVGTRARIDAGVLGVVAVYVGGAVDAQKLAALEAAGQVQRFSGWQEWAGPEFEVRSATPVEIGVDGEALTLEPPLRFVVRPAALTVRLPRHAAGVSPAASTVRVADRGTVTALWRVALGQPAEGG